MTTIKPSDGLNFARQSVFVSGKIAGAKIHTDNCGGRWVVSISDLSSPLGRSDAVLAVNEEPTLNPAVHALGVTVPNSAILKLFSDVSFESLFLPGTEFRAEAVVGVLNGQAWFNVSQIILFEPQFMIGTRQVYNEPICPRRLHLRSRGIKVKRSGDDSGLRGPFIGNLMHSCFQEIVASNERDSLIAEFNKDPKKFLLQAIQPEAVLLGAIGQVGDEPRIIGNEWSTVKSHIDRLLNSESVRRLLASEKLWFSEVPVSGGSIRGEIDLRSPSQILELKTGSNHPSHSDQLCVYLIGEMLEHGYGAKDRQKAYLLYAGGYVPEDLRVQRIQGNSSQLLETLDRFLLSRHRLLLVSAGKMLPKIELPPGDCLVGRCEYYPIEQPSRNACHFYCQTDRNWPCEECVHSSVCIEHSRHHSFEVLDEANRLRVALNMEIEHQQRMHFHSTNNTAGCFDILHKKTNHILVLKPTTGCGYDPPSPGEKITLKYDGVEYLVGALMGGVDEDGNWTVISKGTTFGKVGSTILVAQQRSELYGIYYLQGCIDELQRLGEVSNREGISFAGGGIVSSLLTKMDSVETAIADVSITDIFCQSFDVRNSRELLRTVLGEVLGRVLIVTEAAILKVDGALDLRGPYLLGATSGLRSITDALAKVKDELCKHRHWIISPDMLLDTEVCRALPGRGVEYFNYVITYETNSVTALEYFLLRQYGRRMVTIGDANCIGRPLRSSQSKLLGLGDNLMTRVYNRGFPKIEGKFNPKIINPKTPRISLALNNALKSCRMLSAEYCTSEVRVEAIICEGGSYGSPFDLVGSREIDIDDGPPMELKLMIEEPLPASEIDNDLRDLKSRINYLLVGNAELISPTSGRRYVVRQTPSFRNDQGGRWLVQFYMSGHHSGYLEPGVAKVIQKIGELSSAGVKPKNLAVMSPLPQQLAMIIERYGDKLGGIALRTPYGIRGESWGHVIISCGSWAANNVDSRELYTMIRAGITHVHIIAEQDTFANHPFLRAMHVT